MLNAWRACCWLWQNALVKRSNSPVILEWTLDHLTLRFDLKVTFTSMKQYSNCEWQIDAMLLIKSQRICARIRYRIPHITRLSRTDILDGIKSKWFWRTKHLWCKRKGTSQRIRLIKMGETNLRILLAEVSVVN